MVVTNSTVTSVTSTSGKGTSWRNTRQPNMRESYITATITAYPFDGGLRRHKATVHDGKRIECPHCDYKATTNGNLSIHIAAKHEREKIPL